MKRILLLAVLISFGLPGNAQASPAYGTGLPAKNQFFGGLQYYYIERRAMEGQNGSIRSRQEYVTLSYGVIDRLSLDLKWMINSRFEQDPRDGTPQMEYNRSIWGGGYGFRVRVYETGPFKVVTGFQHFSNHPKTVKANGAKQNGILEDWQGSTLLSVDLKKIVPYIGVRYATLDYIHTVNDERSRIRSCKDDRWSGIAGVDIPLTTRVWLNAEVEPEDGGSYTGAVYFRF